MHRFIPLFMILALSSPTLAASQDSSEKAVEAEKKPAENKKTDADPAPGSSRSNRQGKVADLLLAAGWDNFERNGGGGIAEHRNGLVGSVYLSRDTKLGLGIFGGTAVINNKIWRPVSGCDPAKYTCSLIADYAQSEEKLSALALSLVHFLGNSFKVNSEVNYRTIDFSGLKLSAVGISVGFGNQWSWDAFTLTWDWIRYTKNVSLKYDKLDVLDQYPGGYSAAISTIALGWAW